MPTDVLTHPPVTAETFADQILDIVQSDADGGMFDNRTCPPPVDFADLHCFCDANEYLLEAADALGLDLFDVGGGGMSDRMLDLCNAATALVSARMARLCEACGEPVGPFATRYDSEVGGIVHAHGCSAG